MRIYVASVEIRSSPDTAGPRSIELNDSDRLAGVHAPDVLVHVGRLLAAELAVRTLVPRRLAALVPKVTQHRVPPSVAVVTLRTVKFPCTRVVQHVPSLRELSQVITEPATYKTSCQSQSTSDCQPILGQHRLDKREGREIRWSGWKGACVIHAGRR